MEETAESGKVEDRLCAAVVDELDGLNQSLLQASSSRWNKCQENEGTLESRGGCLDLPCSSDPSYPDSRSYPESAEEEKRRSRDRVLELVAMRLRRIGDVMDGDFRDVTMTSRRRRRAATDRTSGRRLLDLFPVPPTSRKRLLAVRDFACETLTRDLAYVTGRRDVIVVAGRTMVGCVLLELVSLVACPVKFGSKGSEWTHWSIR